MLIDSHCHLDFPDFAGQIDAVLDRARQAGVDGFLTIGTKLRQFANVQAIAEAHPRVWCSVGIHPHEAAAEAAEADTLVAMSRHPKVVGIGECGLDYYHDHSPRDQQQANFRAHIDAAIASGLPLIVHARDADDDMAEMLEAGARAGRLTGVLHCFSSSRRLAERAVDLGFHISFSGILTFKNADELRETARALPLDRLLVETDAPYLAPVPMRGKTNEPAFVAHTAARLAEIKNAGLAELARVTSDNFFRLFDKAAAPA